MNLTKDQIFEYINNSEAVISFYRFAMIIGFWPDFCDYEIEKLAWYLEDAKINDIKLLDTLLSENQDILNRYIAHIYANRKNPWRVTPGFLCVLALIMKFPKLFTEDSLVEKGWDRELANIVLSSTEHYACN